MSPTEALSFINVLAALAQTPAGEVRMSELKSAHDVGSNIVRCYHPSATYNGINLIERPWSKAKEWRAESSALFVVHYKGYVTRLDHQMVVAVMRRDKSIMALPLRDANLIPPNKDCPLKNWYGSE